MITNVYWIPMWHKAHQGSLRMLKADPYQKVCNQI